jgi:gliding motility-associated lipoprotein GldH
MNLKNIFISLFICIICCSCNKDAIYRKYIALPGNIWDVNKPLVFDIPISDTINKYNIFLTIRNLDGYGFSNLYLFIDIISPAHKTERDTFQYILADDRGRWVGNGLGDLWDSKELFKMNSRFSKSGMYKFILTQAMRVDSLPDIMDAGISIEQSVKQK